jgi:predicted ATPase/DNA-binding CsgD family transcriptional regulator
MEGQSGPHDASTAPSGVRVSGAIPQTLRLQTLSTPFIGRERQVAEARALLDRDPVRLLTLTGPGGIGKTRLALAVAEAVRGDFPDGVHYVSLAPLTDPSLVASAIAQSLGVIEAGAPAGQSLLLEHLQHSIGEQKLLLVLDNFEQVIEASEGVAVVLGACSRLKVLVTSREVLRISAEHAYPVPPMALPEPDTLPPLESLAEVEAIRLFVTRAQAAQPDFELTPTNATAVAEICHRLDGLPLAIELAAARVRLIPPPAMLARLERWLPWLSGGPRDAPARHHTLRDAIRWSYDLLEPHEQQLLRRISVFVSGCTLDAVEVICGDFGSPSNPKSKIESLPSSVAKGPKLIAALGSLVDKSLLRNEGSRPGMPAGAEQGRLYMLETIREYALEQLATAGEGEALRLAHARFYIALAEEAEPQLTSPNQPAWLATLEEEHDNLRAALTWAVDKGEVELAARLATPLWRFWLRHGHLSEGRRWLETVLALGAVRPHSLSPVLRARALNGAGRLALRQGDYAPARALLEEALVLWHGIADKRGELDALNSLGLITTYQNELSQAESYLEQSIAGWRELGDKWHLALVLGHLGVALRRGRKLEPAAKCYEESLALARELQDKYIISSSLNSLGQMAHHQGDDRRAHRLLAESLSIVRQIGDKVNISEYLADIAGVWAALGQPERAARLFGASEALREKMRVVMYEGQRLAYVRDVERGKAQLDATTWEAAWAEGRHLSLDDAFALALEELPSAPPETPAPQHTYDLTERELEVLRLLVSGLTYGEIATQLTLSFHTVHAHLRSIYAKLGVKSRNQATRFATEQGLV